MNKIDDKTKVQEWTKFSIAPHTEDELREAYLDPDGYHKICTSYVCQHSRMC